MIDPQSYGFRTSDELHRRYPDGAPELAFDDEDDLRSRYLRGLCSVLAVAVHLRTEWQLVGVYQPFQAAHEAPWHVGCLTPAGEFVDANGIQPVEVALSSLTGIGDLETRPLDKEYVLRTFLRHPALHEAARREHLDRLICDLPTPPRMAFS